MKKKHTETVLVSRLRKKARRATFQREKMKFLKGGMCYVDDPFLIMRRQRSKSRFMNA